MENKVVITGLNMITSLGLNINENWENLLAGKNGVKNITLFDPENNLTRFAAQLPNSFEKYWSKKIKKRIARQMTRVCKMSYVCAIDAVDYSDINFNEIDKSRCGVILGIVNTGDSSVENGTTAKNRIIKKMNNALSAWISLRYKLEGPNFTVSSACSSSAYAIGLGYDLIKSGQADLIITGSADSIINPT